MRQDTPHLTRLCVSPKVGTVACTRIDHAVLACAWSLWHDVTAGDGLVLVMVWCW